MGVRGVRGEVEYIKGRRGNKVRRGEGEGEREGEGNVRHGKVMMREGWEVQLGVLGRYNK